MRIATKPYKSRFFLWNGMGAIIISTPIVPFHSHDTIQLMIDLNRRFRFQVEDCEWAEYSALVVRENVVHRMDSNGSMQLLLYIDPTCSAGERLSAKHLKKGGITSLPLSTTNIWTQNILRQFTAGYDADRVHMTITELLSTLIEPEASDVGFSESVSTVIDIINGATDKSILSIRHVASKVFLSESRLRHLFTKEVGIPLHKYILWTKMKYSINQLVEGKSITEASHEAGFSDSSHYYKTMSRMLGIIPSDFVKNNRQIEVVSLTRNPIDFTTRFYSQDQPQEVKLSSLSKRT